MILVAVISTPPPVRVWYETFVGRSTSPILLRALAFLLEACSRDVLWVQASKRSTDKPLKTVDIDYMVS